MEAALTSSPGWAPKQERRGGIETLFSSKKWSFVHTKQERRGGIETERGLK